MSTENQTKKNRGPKIFFVNSFMVVLVLIITIALLLVSMGYRLGWDGSLERTGMIQFNSLPVGAVIDVDGQRLNVVTNTSRTFSSGWHSVTIFRDGYGAWSKRLLVEPGVLSRLNYVRLIPTNRNISDVKSYEKNGIYKEVVSSDRRTLVVMRDMANWDYVDLRGADPKVSGINITPAFSKVDLDSAKDVQIIDWGANSTKVLVRLTKADDSLDWAVIDLTRSDQSVNLNREYARQFARARFSDGSGELVAVVEAGNLYNIEVSRKIMTGVIANQVEQIYVSRGLVGFVRKNEWKEKEIGLWQVAMDDAYTLKTFGENEWKEQDIRLSFGKFEDRGWVAYFMGEKCFVYEVDIERIDDLHGQEPVVPVEMAIGMTPKSLKLSPGGRFVLAEGDGKNSVLDMDLLEQHAEIGRDGGGEINWLDDYMLYRNTAEGLVVFDFDGMNLRRTLNIDERSVVVSPDNRYLYYFVTDDDATADNATAGQTQLKRWQLIL